MAGLQARLNRSLQVRLSVWLSVVLVATALAAGVVSFASAFKEANELQDDQLRQVAALIDDHDLPVRRPEPALVAQNTDPESRVIVQMLGASAQARGDDPAALDLPGDLPDGLHTVTVGADSWRLLVRPLPSGRRLVVGQQTAARDEIARDSAIRTVMPLVALIPVLVILIGVMVRRMLRPVTQLAAEADHRSEHDLSPLSDDHVPREIRPFIASINRLLARVAQSVETQRRFVADAAHELRSPLTALSLQAENLASVDLPPPAQTRLATLRQGLVRASSLLDQLLTLARTQAAPLAATTTPPCIALQPIVRRALEEMLPLAEARRIDLGMEQADPAAVPATEVDLTVLLRNLLDNAIRYTPEGGRVDVRVVAAATSVTIEVADNGPGIPAAEQARIFDPFYRVLGNEAQGSGLGLSIVKSIVTRLGGEIAVHSGDAEAVVGTLLRVVLPGGLEQPAIPVA